MWAWLCDAARTGLVCGAIALCLLVVIVGLAMDTNAALLGGVYFEPILLLLCLFVLFTFTGCNAAIAIVQSVEMSGELTVYPRALRVSLMCNDEATLTRIHLGQ
ncbi:hypothetical protein B484DRAFT_406908, partial [Ochromonadaceae sp. CCMP2298]